MTKKFTAINLGKKRIGDDLAVEMIYGDFNVNSYGGEYEPVTEFDTEEDAIAYVKRQAYGKWAIIPIITFDNES